LFYSLHILYITSKSYIRNSIKYHLTARPSKYAKNKIWYAWWWEIEDEGKKHRIFRSTSQRLKNEAEQVIEEWQKGKELQASGTLGTFAKNFFLPGRCLYLAWKSEQGGLKAHTVYEHRKNLEKYMLPQFGSSLLAELGPVKIEKWLRSLPLSGSTKNSIINTFNLGLKEAKREKRIRELPGIRCFARRSMRPDIQTTGETKTLFPDTRPALEDIWQIDGQDRYGFMFGVMFRVMLHAGLRPGEGRALSVEQLYPEYNGILVNRQVDSEEVVALPKKETTEDRRMRLVVIPTITIELLKELIRELAIRQGFLFLYNERLVRKEYLEKRFKKGLENAGIHAGERNLVPYSLRYTFRSKTHGILDAELIREMMGHRSQEISEHYLRVNPEQFAIFKPYMERIERLW
jgi:integrase